MARKKRKSRKGHMHKRRKHLKRRYGRSLGAGGGQVTMNVTGTLVLDPQQLEEAVAEAVEEAAIEALPEVAAEAAEVAAEEAVERLEG